MDRRNNKSFSKNPKGKRKSAKASEVVATKEKTTTASTSQTSNKIDVVIGLDISTTCTAMVVVNKATGDLLMMHHELMNNKNKFADFWDKVKHMESSFMSLPDENWNVVKVAVEENAKRFSPGYSSADTIITLAKFNGIISYFLFKKYGVKPSYLNVRTSRKLLGLNIDYKNKSKTTKQKVLDQVVARNPDFPWVYREVKGDLTMTKINEDRADAWVMAESGRRT